MSTAVVLSLQAVSAFRLAAIRALRSIGGLLAWAVVIDGVVLDQGHKVRGDPVHEQSGGEVEEKYGEADGEQSHQPALLGVYVLRCDLGRREHGHRRDNRQDVVGVRVGEVLEPQDPTVGKAIVFRRRPTWSTAELPDNVEDPDKYRHLDQDREASAERVHPLLLVELGHLLPLPLGIILELGADPIHVRFQILHRAHAPDLLYRQREEEAAYYHRQHHDRKPPGYAERLMEVQQYSTEDIDDGAENALEEVCDVVDHQILLILR